MALECGVITAMFAVILIVFLRKKRKLWALATLPLMLIPFTQFIMQFLVVDTLHADIGPFGRILALLIAVGVSCAWIGAVSGPMKNNKIKVTYVGIANVFNVLLAAILVRNILLTTVLAVA